MFKCNFKDSCYRITLAVYVDINGQMSHITEGIVCSYMMCSKYAYDCHWIRILTYVPINTQTI